jgi:hypothetical protein
MDDQERKPRRTLQQMQVDAMTNEGNNGWGCPKCGCCDLRVTNTWVSQGVRKRLRKCRNCGTPISTCEKFE